MKVKSLIKKLSISGAVSMILIGGVIPSFASNNWKDSSFQFDFPALNSADRYTPGRAKRDTSKSYMKCDTITAGYSYKAQVYASLGAGNYIDASGGHIYEFTKGRSYYMTNLVREKGYTAAAIKANAGTNIRNVTAGGVWSPDNVNGY